MTILLKQSTSVVVQFGPFVDKTTGVDLEVGLATAMDNATTGIRLSKNGAAFADRGDATVPAYDAMGCYRITLSTTDTGTLGTLRMIFEEAATCLPVWMDFMVVTANVWDTLCSTDQLDVNVTNIAGTAQTGVDVNDILTDTADMQPRIVAIEVDTQTTLNDKIDTIDSEIGTMQGNVTDIIADTNELQGDWTNTGRLDIILDSILADTGELQADDVPALIAALDVVVDRVEADTQDIQTQIGTAGAGLGDLGGMSTAMKAEVQSEVDTVMKTDTIAERTNGAPTATPTFEEAISYIYMMLTNKIDVDSGFKEFYNNGGTIIWKKALTDDASNYVEANGEAGS